MRQYTITLSGDLDNLLVGDDAGVKITLKGFRDDGLEDHLAAAIMGVIAQRMVARIIAGETGTESVQ